MRYEKAAKVFLGALWMVCVYRAVTQSITHDEALTYELYLTGPFSGIFRVFSANHHFLNTLLMYVSTSLFGLSEWSMRLPALAGAALYFAAVYRTSRHVFGASYSLLLAVGLLTLNPFILDFMVAARGYGLALGLWMWALALLLPYLDEAKGRTPRRLIEAAVALSLSVTANLVFALPAAMLAGTAIWLLRKRSAPEPVKKGRKPAPAEPSPAIYFVLPIVSMAVLFLIISPLESSGSSDFYAGASSLAESLRSLASVSLAHGGPLRQNPFTGWATDALAFFLAPVILLGALAVHAFRRNLLLLLCSTVAIGSALLLLLLHLALNMPYPLDRTRHHFLPLVSLALLGLIAAQPRREVAFAAYALSGALLCAFLLQWNVRKFLVWEYDADTREIGDRISASVPDKRPDAVRVGITWQLEPSLNFYRDKNRWTWMQPLSRTPLNQAYDYYVVALNDRPAVEGLGLKPMYQGRVSGTLLAKK